MIKNTNANKKSAKQSDALLRQFLQSFEKKVNHKYKHYSS